MHNRKVGDWRSEKYNDVSISVKVPSVDIINHLAVDSVYFTRVLFSFSLSSINGVDESAVRFKLNLDVVVDTASGVVASVADSVCVFYMSLRTMFLK